MLCVNPEVLHLAPLLGVAAEKKRNASTLMAKHFLVDVFVVVETPSPPSATAYQLKLAFEQNGQEALCSSSAMRASVGRISASGRLPVPQKPMKNHLRRNPYVPGGPSWRNGDMRPRLRPIALPTQAAAVRNKS